MSTVTPQAPANPTRQQLDELDALLQRMLELPVNQLDEPTAVVQPLPPRPTAPRKPLLTEKLPHVEVPQPRLEKPVQAMAPQHEQASSAKPLPPLSPVSVVDSSWPTTMDTKTASFLAKLTPSAEPHPERAAPVPPPQPRTLTPTYDSSTLRQPKKEPLQSTPPAIPAVDESIPWNAFGWLGPLVLVNRIFDLGLTRLGATGHWLGQRRGKALLGYAGLLMLGAALALVLMDLIGWTW